MPGKYSHSVVLAEYSTRGIIELPSEQHVAYIKASPYAASQHSRQGSSWSQNPPTPQKRSQSALAYTGPHNSNHHGVTPPRRPIGTSRGAEPATENHHRYYQQRAFTPDVRSRNGVDAKGSPQRQPENSVRAQAAQSKMTARPAGIRDGILRHPNGQEERLRVDEFLRDMPNPPKPTENQPVTVAPEAKTKPVTPRQSKPGSTTQPSSDTEPAQPGSQPTESAQAQNPSNNRPSQALQHQGSHDTQIYHPNNAPAEPDFDDFSDSEQVQDSYFEDEGVSEPKPARSSHGTTPRTSSRDTESRAQPGPSTLGEHPDTEIFPETIVNPLGSHRKVDSMASMPTTNGQGDRLVPSSNKQVESKKPTAQHSAPDWALPEIDEDASFNPHSFAEELKNPSSHASKENISKDPNGHLMGAVSSGRDVDFTKEEHIESDDDAAIPPDIGRYRDEEDAMKPAIAKSKKSEAIVGKTSQTPKPKKAGFFARFRSRSRSRA